MKLRLLMLNATSGRAVLCLFAAGFFVWILLIAVLGPAMYREAPDPDLGRMNGFLLHVMFVSMFCWMPFALIGGAMTFLNLILQLVGRRKQPCGFEVLRRDANQDR